MMDQLLVICRSLCKM